MAFHLKSKESVRHGLRRLARAELKSAARSLDGKATPSRTGAVHGARRSLKKVRAILALLREDRGHGLKKHQRRLRDMGRALSKVRDVEVSVEVFDRVRQRSPSAVSKKTGALIQRQLVADRDRLLRDPKTKKTMAAAAGVLRKSARRARRWRSRHRNFPALAAALRQSRHDAQLAMNHARSQPQAETFHEWRKAVKTLWYELRLLEACGTSVRAELRALDRIQGWLGDDHNVVILCHRLVDHEPLARNAEDLQKFQAAAENYQRHLRKKALAKGEEMFATPAPRFVDRVERGWREWRRQ